MTTDAELRTACEMLTRGAWTHHDKDADGNEIMIDRTNDMHRLASAILALVEERRYLRERMDAAEQTLIEERAEAEESHEAFELLSSECTEIEARANLAESRLGKAVEALEKIAGLTDAEAHVCGEMLRNYARSVLSDLEKSE